MRGGEANGSVQTFDTKLLKDLWKEPARPANHEECSYMATRDQPTLLSQLWAQVEPTILGTDPGATERITARTAFLSGVQAILMVVGRAKARGGRAAAMQALEDMRADLKREAGRRRTTPRMQ